MKIKTSFEIEFENGEKISLKESEARLLLYKLKSIFESETNYYPVYPTFPSNPYYPVIYTTSDKTTGGNI